MTCVVASPLSSLNDYFGFQWSGTMNPDGTNPRGSIGRAMARGYGFKEPESKKSSSSAAKKRASRAGTRSVNTLSAAQLERKRANDREAQRAIRQRTKDHIDHLEKSLDDLRNSNESTEKALYAAHQRGRDLEDEVNYLRAKLSEAGFNMAYPLPEGPRHPDGTLIATQDGSPASQPVGTHTMRSNSVATHHSHPGAPSQSPVPRNGPFSSNEFPQSSMNVTSGGSVGPPSLTTWRSSHDSTPSLPSTVDLKGNSQDPSDTLYSATSATERVEWPNGASSTQSYPLDSESGASHGQQHVPQYVQDYAGAAAQSHTQVMSQGRGFHAPIMSADYQGIPVSGASGNYQLSSHQPFPSTSTYSMTPMQVNSSEYHPSSNPLQPPTVPSSSYHQSGHDNQTYASQQSASVPYRDASGSNHNYSVAAFAST